MKGENVKGGNVRHADVRARRSAGGAEKEGGGAKRYINPALAAALCLCPVLGGAATAKTGLALGLSLGLVYGASIWLLSLCQTVISPKARGPALLIVAGGFASVLALLLDTFTPALYAPLTMYVPLLAANCLLLDWSVRTDPKAPREPDAQIDIAISASLTMCLVGLLREFLGAGTAFGVQILPEWSAMPAGFSAVPGAFLLLGLVLMGTNALGLTGEKEDAE